MQKDRYQGHRIAKHGIVIQGQRSAITVSFSDLAQLLEDLCKEFAAPDDDLGVCRPRKQSPLQFIERIHDGHLHV